MNKNLKILLGVFLAQLAFPLYFWVKFGYPSTATPDIWTPWLLFPSLPPYYAVAAVTLFVNLLFAVSFIFFYFALCNLYNEKVAFWSTAALSFLPSIIVWRMAFWVNAFLLLPLFAFELFIMSFLPFLPFLPTFPGIPETSPERKKQIFYGIISIVTGMILILYFHHISISGIPCGPVIFAPIFLYFGYLTLEKYTSKYFFHTSVLVMILISVLLFIVFSYFVTHQYHLLGIRLTPIPYDPLSYIDVYRFGYYPMAALLIFFLYSFYDRDIFPFLICPLIVVGQYWNYVMYLTVFFLPIPLVTFLEWIKSRHFTTILYLKATSLNISFISLLIIVSGSIAIIQTNEYAPRFGTNTSDFYALEELRSYPEGKVMANIIYKDMVKAVTGFDVVEAPFWWLTETDAAMIAKKVGIKYVMLSNREFRVREPYYFFLRPACGEIEQQGIQEIRLPFPNEPCRVFAYNVLPDRMAYMMVYGGNMKVFKEIIEESNSLMKLKTGKAYANYKVKIFQFIGSVAK